MNVRPERLVGELWLPAAGVGVLVVLAASVALIWAAAIEAPDSATVFGSTVSCDAVHRDSGPLLPDAAGELSAGPREVESACAERPARRRLRLAGLFALPFGTVWTALSVYAGVKVNQRMIPTALD